MLLPALWIWTGAVAGCAVLAAAVGGNPRHVGEATALALAPALAGFVLWPILGRALGAWAFVICWIVAGIGLIAGSGGVLSPLGVMTGLAPVWVWALRRPWVAEAGATAVLSYAGACVLALSAPVYQLGPYPEFLAVVSIGLAAGLIASVASTRDRPEAPPAAAGRRIAEVSHELRTPLTHILGFSEMIERQMFGDLNPRYVEYAKLIRTSGAHLLALVNDLLDLSKIEAGAYALEFAVFDVRAVVAESVRLALDSARKKDIALAMTTPELPVLVRADEQAIRRMVVNLLGNAIKFTPDGGRVLMSVRTEGEAIVLEAIDNGPGIPEQDREKLGQPFERGAGAARAEGTGLGLAMVRALATLHGGALSFHDAPGGGALVRISLPAPSDQA
ncbi:MAG: HAMP domain-containing histidine kinase [Hyphomonadaceae bacterium]|nr:HAMP domain-containing histidine kinase [Hyphomonadaceae bacterium]